MGLKRSIVGFAALILSSTCATAAQDPLRTRLAPDGINFPLSQEPVSKYKMLPAFPRLKFERPVFMTYSPQALKWLFVVEQNGKIHSFENQRDPDRTEIFLDVSNQISSEYNEMGLLGLAFDPTEMYFYLNYTTKNPLQSVVSRFKYIMQGDVPTAIKNSEKILLTVPQPYSNHKGGMLAFGPDKNLYIGFGDGGSGGDPHGNGQKLNTLLGKILRIDPRTPDRQRGKPYSIPSDNPFVDRRGALPEIYAYGLRNPWRFSFDKRLGTLWVGDVGQNEWEEINIVKKGDNLGWSYYEGEAAYDGIYRNIPQDQNFVKPIFVYPHPPGVSVTGGYVYRGNRIPELRGQYLYGDFAAGTIWAMTVQREKQKVISNKEIAEVPMLASFAEDDMGELYGISLEGSLYRLAKGTEGGKSALPALLSKTGFFTDVKSLSPAPGMIEYDVNSPLWSDGAIKRRWIGVPGNEKINFDAADPWTFPVGTAMVKHFELKLASGEIRRLETRVFFLHNEGWVGYTYRWKANETDALLLTRGASEKFDIQDPDKPGEVKELQWTFPTRGECLNCHTRSVGVVLGVQTQQLNKIFDYTGAPENQLRAWSRIGLFNQNVGDPAQYEAWASPSDASASIAKRARSYLASNCAHCHNPSGPTPVNMDLRFTTELDKTKLISEHPMAGDLGLIDAARVKPGDKKNSVVWERMRRTDQHRMPPLATRLPDSTGIEVLGEWIDQGAVSAGLPKQMSRSVASIQPSGFERNQDWKSEALWNQLAQVSRPEGVRAMALASRWDSKWLGKARSAAEDLIDDHVEKDRSGAKYFSPAIAQLGDESVQEKDLLSVRSQASGMGALLSVFQGSGKEEDLKPVIEMYEAFYQRFYDKKYGGFFARYKVGLGQPKMEKSFDSALAVPTEFLLDLYEMDADPKRKVQHQKTLQELADLVSEKFYDKKTGWIHESFDVKWNAVQGVSSLQEFKGRQFTIGNVGRNLQAAWFLLEMVDRKAAPQARLVEYKKRAGMILNSVLKQSAFSGKRLKGPIDREYGGFVSQVTREDGQPWSARHKYRSDQVFGIMALTLAEKYGVVDRKLAQKTRNGAIDFYLAHYSEDDAVGELGVLGRDGAILPWLNIRIKNIQGEDSLRLASSMLRYAKKR